ncbi:hypothetical protein D3C72_1589950 [compost metagenome]
MERHRQHPRRQTASGAYRRRRAAGRRHAVRAAGRPAAGAGQPALPGVAAGHAGGMADQGMDHDQRWREGRLRRSQGRLEHHGRRRRHQADAAPLSRAAAVGPLRDGVRHRGRPGGHAAPGDRREPERRRGLVQPGDPAGRALAGRRRQGDPGGAGSLRGLDSPADQHGPQVRYGAAVLHHRHGAGCRPAGRHPDPAQRRAPDGLGATAHARRRYRGLRSEAAPEPGHPDVPGPAGQPYPGHRGLAHG